MIEHGVDIDTPDNNYYETYTKGFTPYQTALMRGLPEIAELIKAKGGNAEPLSGDAQFKAACMLGDLESARSLATSYGEPDLAANHEMLCEAAGNGNLIAVSTMIELGFDLNPKGQSTALHVAAWRGQLDIIKALLAAGADSTLRDPQHYSPPLGHALYAQRQDVIDVLMQARMDIFLAAAMGQKQQIEARLAEDPTWLNAPFSRVRPAPEKVWANDWATPLWYAAMNGQVDTVRYLLDQGADPTVKDPEGRSIVDYADEAGQADCARVIDVAASNALKN